MHQLAPAFCVLQYNYRALQNRGRSFIPLVLFLLDTSAKRGEFIISVGNNFIND